MHRTFLLSFACLFSLMLLWQGCADPADAKPVATGPATPDEEWFQQNVVDSPKLVIVDFYADWCGPCRQLSPLLEKLAAEYDGQLEVVKVDVDERESLAVEYDVNSIPLVLVMYQGEVLEKMVGLAPYSELEELVKPHLGLIQAEVADPRVLDGVE